MSRPIQCVGTSTPWSTRCSASSDRLSPITRSSGVITEARPGLTASRRSARACSVSSSSHSESPTSWPCAHRNGKHIAPPIISTSAIFRKRSITPILSATFEPPTITTSGRTGSCIIFVSVRTSLSKRRPAALGSRWATPSVEAWARWHTPKASLTYTSASWASAAANSGSFVVSPGSKRTFSSRSTSPSPSSSVSALTSSPTTAGASVTFASVSSLSRSATGAIDRRSSRTPFGRPRWETSTSLAPRARSSSIVLSDDTIRVSSLTTTSPSGSVPSGTLKSTRTSTRLPRTSRSSMLLNVLHPSAVRSASPHRPPVRACPGPAPSQNPLRQIHQAVGVAPLVVVPRDDLEHRAVQHGRQLRVDDRREGRCDDVARDDRVLGVLHERRERTAAGGRLERPVYLLDASLALALDSEIDDRPRGDGSAHREAVQLALQRRDHETDRLRSSRRGRDQVDRRGARAAQVFVGEVLQALVGRVRVDRRHQPVPDADGVVDDLGHGRQAVGRARGVRDHVVAIAVIHLVEVDPQDDGRVGILGRCRDDHLLGTLREVHGGAVAVGEPPGRLDHDVDAQIPPRKCRGIGLGEHLQLLSIHLYRTLQGMHVARVGTEDRVVVEQVCKRPGVGQVVGGHPLDVGPRLLGGTKDVTTDPAKSIDPHAYGHSSSPEAKMNDAGPRDAGPSPGEQPEGYQRVDCARLQRVRGLLSMSRWVTATSRSSQSR